MKQSITRRTILKGMMAGTTGVILNRERVLADERPQKNQKDVFAFGVSSGDPTDSSVVLWTAVSRDHYNEAKQLDLELCLDPNFQQIVRQETLFPGTSEFGLERDCTAAIKVEGLESYQTYYYRFRYGNTVSRIGRAKTLPGEGVKVDKIKYAFLTCQDYTTGYFNALGHLADQEDLDFVIHLGDFIYEYNAYPDFEDEVKRSVGLSNRKQALDLDDFRKIYRVYRSDENLQRALAAHTFIITIDDHEIGDNAYHDYENDTAGLGYYKKDPHPLSLTKEEKEYLKSNEPTMEIGEKLKRLRQHRDDAMKAWREYVPSIVGGSEDKIYRSFKVGKNLEVFVTDSRSYRHEEPCSLNFPDIFLCHDYENPSDQHFMLGETQREWLVDGIVSSDSVWKIWANQTLLSQLANTSRINDRRVQYINYDAWDGYQKEREMILQQVEDAQALGDARNFVVLTGDMHTVLGSEVKVNYSRRNPSDTIGFEFMTPSITSPNLQDTVKKVREDSILARLLRSRIKKNNRHIKHFASNVYGYSTMEHYEDAKGDPVAKWRIYHIDKLSPVVPGNGNVGHDSEKSKAFRYEPKNGSLTPDRI